MVDPVMVIEIFRIQYVLLFTLFDSTTDMLNVENVGVCVIDKLPLIETVNVGDETLKLDNVMLMLLKSPVAVSTVALKDSVPEIISAP